MDEELPWAWDYRPSVGVPTGPPAAPLAHEDADALAARLAEAERPVILAGAGATGDGVVDLLGRLGEATGALLATTLRAKGLFDGLPYAVGLAGAFATRPARELFAEADLVVAFGASLNYFTTEGGYLFPQADVVSIDLGTAKHRKELDVETHVADSGLAAEALLARTPAGVAPRGYRATPLDLDSILRPSELDRPADTPGVLHSANATLELDRLLGDDTAFVIGVGHFWSFPIMYLHGRGADHYHVTYDFGSIGQALPAGIGFLAARPHAPTVVIEGDGSLLMQVQELDTLSRMSGPLLVVVMNDGAYSAETHKLRAKGHPEDSAVFGAPDLASVSTALGVPGRRVDDLETLRTGVEEFLRLRQPMLLDVRISAEVVSAPFRRTIFGEDA